jgi:hypothetical protein
MKCPHCIVEVDSQFKENYIGDDSDGYWSFFQMKCPNPECGRFIIELAMGTPFKYPTSPIINGLGEIKYRIFVNPIASTRKPVPQEVDQIFAKDYKEACLILSFSPKASAALSRRCLQNVLREKASIKNSDLSKEIQEVIDRKLLPSYLLDDIDALRNIGNFAAHPIKSTSTGEIVEVETGEAEWLLEVLELLFDFYFVQPGKSKKKREALNIKLDDAGKPSMK